MVDGSLFDFEFVNLWLRIHMWEESTSSVNILRHGGFSWPLYWVPGFLLLEACAPLALGT